MLRETHQSGSMTLIPVEVQPAPQEEKEIRVHLPNGIAVTFSQVESPAQLLQALYHLEPA